MTIKFAKRAASNILNRGMSAIRVKPSSFADVDKAITRDDVRRLIGSGDIYALPAKHNISANSKELRKKRSEGRMRGPGNRRGTRKARQGRTWEKKVRSQRFFLKRLKAMNKIDTKKFNELYGLVKGNVYADKQSLILHLREEGVTLSEQELKQINDLAKQQYQ